MRKHRIVLILLPATLFSQAANSQVSSSGVAEAKHNQEVSQKLHDHGDDEQALSFADKAIKLAPQRVEFHLWKAQLLLDTQDDDHTALAEANRACSIAPNAYSEYLRARLLYRLQQRAEALRAVNRSVELGPSVLNLQLKAEILTAIGRLQEAEDCLGASMKKFGASLDSRILRATIGVNLKHWLLVRDECNQIILAAQSSSKVKLKLVMQAYLLRALASWELKETAQARKEYLAMLAQWPDVREVHVAALHFFKKTGDTKNTEKEKRFLQKYDKDVLPF